jgi:Xaa-Pro aminopeptidase
MADANDSIKNGNSARLEKLREFMSERGIEAAALTYAHYIAALFDGAQIFFGTRAEPPGRAGIIVTGSHIHVLADKTECTRICEEELCAFPNVVPHAAGWYEWRLDEAFARWTGKQKVGNWRADSFGENPAAFRDKMEELLYPLNAVEIERIKKLGQLVARTLVAAAGTLKPGISEQTTAAFMHHRLLREGALPHPIFVAFDERIAGFRHCKPGPAKLKKSALLSITASLKGLFVSATRLTSFAPIPTKLQEETRTANEIETAAILRALPGATAGEIFEEIRTAYGKNGLPQGWREHHLGGPSGFRGRDVKVTPRGEYVLKHGQPFVFNPVFGSGKSEDTFIRLPHSNDLLCLTADGHWPLNRVEIPGFPAIERPGVLEIAEA